VKPVREHSRSERLGGNHPSKSIRGTEQGMIPLDCYCEVFPVKLYLYRTGRKGGVDPSNFTGALKTELLL
jgi:predicted transcriptional regulator with HTH domain